MRVQLVHLGGGDTSIALVYIDGGKNARECDGVRFGTVWVRHGNDPGIGTTMTMVFQTESETGSQTNTNTHLIGSQKPQTKRRVNWGPLFGILLADHILNKKKVKNLFSGSKD